MRYFRIIDGRSPKRSKPCGLLVYDEDTREFSIEIAPEVGTEEVPMLFIPFIEKGLRSIPPDWSLVWVQERIPPPNRQNIGEILAAHHLDEYDELTLLLSGEGRCSQDEFMIQEVEFVAGKSFLEYAVVTFPSKRECDFKRVLADEVKRVRGLKRMTQMELCRRSGVPRAMISKIEHGVANPTIETLTALADGLDTDITFLLS